MIEAHALNENQDNSFISDNKRTIEAEYHALKVKLE